jgi:hypothetical protein
LKYYYDSENPSAKVARGTQTGVETARPIVDDNEILSWFAEVFSSGEMNGAVLEVQ